MIEKQFQVDFSDGFIDTSIRLVRREIFTEPGGVTSDENSKGA